MTADAVIRAVTLGWLTRDDIVLPDGTAHMSVLGGGALYSAIGAALWSNGVGVSALVGEESAASTRAAIAVHGLDGAGVEPIPGRGLELWLLHESDVHKQQVPKIGSALPATLDATLPHLPGSYRDALGYHIAPRTPAGAIRLAADLTALSHRPIVTLDLLADSFVEVSLYRDLRFLRGVTAFLPSEAEINRIWDPPDIAAWIMDQARRFDLHVGAKLGARGAIIAERGGNRLLSVPAYPATVVDTTGAGDAFCGGVLAGLIAGAGLETAAAMGTVSASLVVEACGALATGHPAATERQRRLDYILRCSTWDNR